MENFLTVARQVGVLFMLMGVGAFLRWRKILDERSLAGIVNLLILAVTPCVIVEAFQRPFDKTMLEELALAFVLAALVHVALIVLSAHLFRRGDARTTTVLKLAAVFSNAGFMGIPLEQAILGTSGVFYGAAYIVVFNLVIWSWGLITMQGRRGTAGGIRALVNPGTLGLAFGLPLFFFSVRLPAVVMEPLGMMSNLNTPLAMIAIGYGLAGARLGRVIAMKGAYLAAFVRLVASPLMVIAILLPFHAHLDRNMSLAMVIASASPVAAMVSIFATKFGRDDDAGVGLVSGTTLLSVITMPIVIALAMEFL